MAVDSFFDNNTVTAIVAALFGGTGVRVLDKVLSSRSEHFAQLESLRTELRSEIERLSEELETVKIELAAARSALDEWRLKYWAVYETDVGLKVDIETLRRENTDLKRQLLEK